MHSDPSGMGVEAMRPKDGRVSNGGKGPKRPKHRGSLERKHRIKHGTKRLKRQRST